MLLEGPERKCGRKDGDVEEMYLMIQTFLCMDERIQSFPILNYSYYELLFPARRAMV